MMSSSDASVEVVCNQSNDNENNIMCWMNTTWIDLGEVDVACQYCVLDKHTRG